MGVFQKFFQEFLNYSS